MRGPLVHRTGWPNAIPKELYEIKPGEHVVPNQDPNRRPRPEDQESYAMCVKVLLTQYDFNWFGDKEKEGVADREDLGFAQLFCMKYWKPLHLRLREANAAQGSEVDESKEVKTVVPDEVVPGHPHVQRPEQKKLPGHTKLPKLLDETRRLLKWAYAGESRLGIQAHRLGREAARLAGEVPRVDAVRLLSTKHLE
ncbi:MAG: hypothetical protein M1826_005230 [Phylliscum demangeonii]|nr:MAG: hypothetical protein M1826_005230 [Phylliscum demangeonii]